MTMTIQELLKGKNKDFDKIASNPNSKKIKFLRHKDNRPEELRQILGEPYKGTIYDVYKNDLNKFLDYQRQQLPHTFEGVKYLVSFLGEDGYGARFIGVYENIGIDYTTTDPLGNPNNVHILKKLKGFEDLEERILINWGKGTIRWHQYWCNEKTVIQKTKGIKYNQ